MDGARNNRLEIASIYPAISMTPAAGWQSLDGYKGESVMVLARGQEYSICCLPIEQEIVELSAQDTRISLPFPFVVLFLPPRTVQGVKSAKSRINPIRRISVNIQPRLWPASRRISLARTTGISAGIYRPHFPPNTFRQHEQAPME